MPPRQTGNQWGRCLRGVPFYSVKHTKERCRIYAAVLFESHPPRCSYAASDGLGAFLVWIDFALCPPPDCPVS